MQHHFMFERIFTIGLNDIQRNGVITYPRIRKRIIQFDLLDFSEGRPINVGDMPLGDKQFKYLLVTRKVTRIRPNWNIQLHPLELDNRSIQQTVGIDDLPYCRDW